MAVLETLTERLLLDAMRMEDALIWGLASRILLMVFVLTRLTGQRAMRIVGARHRMIVKLPNFVTRTLLARSRFYEKTELRATRFHGAFVLAVNAVSSLPLPRYVCY